MANIFDSISEKFDYYSLQKAQRIALLGDLGLLPLSIFTPLEIDLLIILVQSGLLSFHYLTKEEKTKDVVQVHDLYDDIITDYGKIVRDFGLTNPLEISTLFEQIYRNGYLSKDKEFVFCTDGVRDIKSIYGANIVSGIGVCRHISSMLDDLYKKLGYESCILGVHLRDYDIDWSVTNEKSSQSISDIYEIIEHISKKEECEELKNIINEFRELGLNVTAEVVFNSKKLKGQANHAINFIPYKGQAFFIDPTNFRDYKLNREHPKFFTNGFDEFIYIDSMAHISNANPKILKKLDLPSQSFYEDTLLRKRVSTLFEKNRDIFEQFYLEHEDIYREMSNKLEKIKIREKRK